MRFQRRKDVHEWSGAEEEFWAMAAAAHALLAIEVCGRSAGPE